MYGRQLQETATGGLRCCTWNVGKSLRSVSLEHQGVLVDMCDVLTITEIGVRNGQEFSEKLGANMQQAMHRFELHGRFSRMLRYRQR